MATIFIGGYFGAGNLGDEAILECMLQDFRALRSDLDFFVTSWNPNQTSKEFNVKGIHWKDISVLTDACSKSNLIILGGGGLFQDYWGFDPTTYLRTSYKDITMYGSIPLLAKLLGIPCMIYAVGLGPFKSKEALQHTWFAFENCQASTLRDYDSLDLLLNSGYFDGNLFPKPQVLADPVFTLSSNTDDDKFIENFLLKNRINPQNNLLAVVLRYWDLNDPDLGWINNIATELNEFLFEHNSFQAILVPFQINEFSAITNDDAINEFLIKYDIHNKYIKLNDRLSPRLTQALIKKCNLVLGMRLHSLIMGINTNTPIVGIPYDPKITSLMKTAGLEDYCCSGFPPERFEVTHKLELAWNNRIQISNVLGHFHEVSFRAAQNNTKIALELISQNSQKPNRKFVEQFPVEQIKLISHLDKSLEIALTQSSELLSELKSTQSQLEKTKRDKAELLLILDNFREDLEHAINEKQDLITEHDLREKTHIRKIDNQNKEITTLRTDLDKIYHSKFWKIASSYYSWINKIKSRFKTEKFSQKDKPLQTVNYLNEIIALLNKKDLRGVFIVSSTLPFDELYNQRVMNLSKFLGNKGYGVIFVAWRWTPSNDLIGDKLEVFKNVFQLPIDLFLSDFNSLRQVIHRNKYFIVEFPHPDLYSTAIRLRKYDFLLVYEIVDNWESFHLVNQADWFNGEIEKSLILNANFITAVSKPLIDKFSNIRQDIFLLPNGYDPYLLGIKNKNISKRRQFHEEINIGYFGHLTDSWFDWEFLISLSELAEQRGINIKFHLIGYGEPDLNILRKFENRISIYGMVGPTNLYQYAKNWDLAMIPFKLGKLAESVDPIKFYEYSYFGLPVIVRGIPHLANYSNVILIQTEYEFLEAIGKLANIKQDFIQNKVLAKILSENTWDNRFTKLLEELESDPWMFL